MPPDISIEAVTGSVRIGMVLTLQRGQSRSIVADALFPYFESRRDYGNGYDWLYYRNLAFGGKPAGLSVCFHSGVVNQIHWNVLLQAVTAEWPTREESDRETDFVRSVLRTMVSRPFTDGPETFTWGTIWSAYDEKGGFASSGLRYQD